MKYLVTSGEMKKYDANTIDRMGIPGMVLMERAAMAAFQYIQEWRCRNAGEGISVLILAGVGNNGGDGLALARLLAETGTEVFVWCVGREDKATGQWKQQREILRNYDVPVGSKVPDREYTILVDALFGVGLSREITGEFAEAVERFNAKKGWKVALDVPSGLDSDTGKIPGSAVRADVTITFGFCKRGLVLYPGCEYAGEVITASVGISEKSFFGEEPGMFCCDETMDMLLPERDRTGNKGTFGKILLVAGDINMAGAALLAARAAYRVGAGMVKVITPPENRIIVQEMLPEALLGTAGDLRESLDWADVIAIGPGMGKSENAGKMLETVICDSRLPLLIDADGINLLAETPRLQQTLKAGGRSVILTPHVGEFSRLMGMPAAVLKEDLPGYGLQLSGRLQAVVVAKDARTFVCREGAPVCVNIRGNSGMATAGSGDVLAGIIAGLLAQGMEAFEAACAGVNIHALAGDRAADMLGEHALLAGDIVERGIR